MSTPEGWQGINADPVAARQAYDQAKGEEELHLASIMFVYFSTQEGQFILEALRRETEAKPTWPNAVCDGTFLALHQARREGENNLYRRIVTLIEIGRKLNVNRQAK